MPAQADGYVQYRGSTAASECSISLLTVEFSLLGPSCHSLGVWKRALGRPLQCWSPDVWTAPWSIKHLQSMRCTPIPTGRLAPAEPHRAGLEPPPPLPPLRPGPKRVRIPVCGVVCGEAGRAAAAGTCGPPQRRPPGPAVWIRRLRQGRSPPAGSRAATSLGRPSGLSRVSACLEASWRLDSRRGVSESYAAAWEGYGCGGWAAIRGGAAAPWWREGPPSDMS